MTKIILHGACGRMGRMITDIVRKDEDAVIVAGVDAFQNAPSDFPLYKTLEEVTEQGDVLVDFSNSKVTDQVIDYCASKKLPAVICTTGLSADQLTHLRDASKVIPVLRSANMSVGINLLLNIRWQLPVLILKFWKNITIRSWMRPAVRRLRWRMP